jgi:dienelactone hydrolase
MFRCVVAALFAGLVFMASFARAAPPVEAYGKLPAVELASLSPSGGRTAFIAVDGETRKLFVVDSDNKPLEALPVGNAKVVAVGWAGEDHLLVTVSGTVDLGPGFTTSKAELEGVVVVNVRTQKSIAVFGGRDDVAHTVRGNYGVAQIGGHWCGYFGGVTYGGGMADYHLDHTFSDLYQVDLDSGAIRRVAEGSELSDGWLVGPDGAVIARASYNEDNGDWKVLTGSAGGRLLASGRSKFGGVRLYRGRTPDTILLKQPPTVDGPSVLQELPLSGGPAVDESDKRDDSLLTDRSGLWIGVVEWADQPETKMFAAVTAARVLGARKAFPDQSVDLLSWSDDFGRMIVFTSGGGDSGTYWIVNIATGSADPLGEAYPEVQTADVGPIRMVDWKAADGLQLHGVLSLPPGRAAKNLPLVVMPHGGPEARDYPVFDWWAQAFASRGYAVFQPNFRGSSGYGAAFRDAGSGEWGRKMQTDISDGVAELARQGIVDPKRACIVGWSYGGYAALAGVTVQQGLYRCAVSMAGVSRPAGMIVNEESKVGGVDASARYWKAFMGAKSMFLTELDPISPLHLAARADAPILLIHGKDDTVVPIGQSQEMASALRSAGKPVDLVVLDGADHWLLHEATRLTMARDSVDFVEKYNPPDAAPVQTSSATSAPSP